MRDRLAPGRVTHPHNARPGQTLPPVFGHLAKLSHDLGACSADRLFGATGQEVQILEGHELAHRERTRKVMDMAKDKATKEGKAPKVKEPTPVNEDEFESGAPTSNHKIADDEGSLLLISVTGIETDIVTAFGKTNAVKADVVIINEKKPSKSEEHKGILIFQRVLQSQLENYVGGRRVFGRLGRGIAKAGQDAPFIIDDPTEADKVLAREYLASIDPFTK